MGELKANFVLCSPATMQGRMAPKELVWYSLDLGMGYFGGGQQHYHVWCLLGHCWVSPVLLQGLSQGAPSPKNEHKIFSLLHANPQ